MTSVDRFISNISAAATVDQIVLALRDEVLNRGIEWTTYEMVVSSEGRQLPFYNTNFPNPFLEQYVEDKFTKDDVIIGHAMERSRPFLWRDIHHNPHLTPAQRRVITAATANKLRSGAMIPLHGPGIVRSYVSVGSQMPIDRFTELFSAYRHELHLISAYAHERVVSLGVAQGTIWPSLSPRELEVLTWTAQGLSGWEISEKIKISSHTVKEHLDRARLKLGAKNKTHAASIGIARGLIRL